MTIVTEDDADKTPKEESLSLGDTTQVKVKEKEEKLQTSEYTQVVLSDEERQAAKELQESFSVFLNDNFEISEDPGIKTTIPTGIDLLDVLLGGGLATSLVMIIGPPGSGKTALATKLLSTGQRRWPGKFLGIFADSEEAMTTDRLAQLGVSRPRLKPYTDLTVERVFKMIEGLCTFKEQHPEMMDIPFGICWDSIANTMTEKGLTEDNPAQVLGQKALMFSHLLPKYVKKLNKYKISLVAVNQLRDKIEIGVVKTAPDLKFLGQQSIPGGKSVLFNSVQLLWIRPSTALQGEYGFNGFKVKCKFVKNKLFTPNIEFTLIFSFERGFSNFWTNYEMLKDTKRIKAGAWCSLTSCPKPSFRQYDAIKCYREDAAFREAWDADVKDVLQTEYIDRYASTDEELTDVF